MEMQNQQLVKLSLGQPHDQPISSLPAGLRRTSSYCIFVKLPKRQDRVLLVHGYTGAYDEVSLDVASFLSSRRTVSAPLYGKWSPEFNNRPHQSPPPEETLAELENRGYLTSLSVTQEKQRFRTIAGLVHSSESKGFSYIVVPGYDCNLRCPYCFQDYMRTDPSFQPKLKRMTPELVDRMLAGILDLENADPDSKRDARQFTFFGGEPLLAANREIVEYIVRRASALGPSVFGAVTNGTELETYRDLLGPDAISSLQITLDGPPRTHDQFRIYADGHGSFEQIARNIVIALDRGVLVSIRVNVCKDNLDDLPGLAMEATQRGWTTYKNFRIYVAPIQPTANFPNNQRLLNSYQLGQSLQKMQQDNQLLNVIETPDDNMKRRALALFQQPEIDPISDFKASFCGAHSGMYIFDPFGDIYACWEKMGDPQIRIGRIGTDNKFVYEMPMFQKWRSRTVATNPTCESCSYALQCGGGCAALAEAKNGTYFSNFCDGFGARFKSAVADAYEAFLTEQENRSGFGELAMAANSFETEPGCL
jgi:uncharacterized protein